MEYMVTAKSRVMIPWFQCSEKNIRTLTLDGEESHTTLPWASTFLQRTVTLKIDTQIYHEKVSLPCS